MTQPNDRTTPDGWTPDDGATVHLDPPYRAAPDEPTAHLGADATVHLGMGDTVRLGGDGATVRLGPDAATVRLGSAPGQRAAGEPTAHLRAAEPADERTVHLGAAAPVGEPTVTAPAGQPTASTTTWEPTAAAPAGWTTTSGPGTVAGGGSGVATSPGGAFGARTAGGGPPATGGEVRFGPGVPPAPPSAPAWPAVAPPPRRRPLWRRLTSVLSTLLTVVLVAVVGLYVWQRLSPLEITGVTVAVPEPAGDRCDVTVDVVATVTTNGRAGEIRYQWLRSGSAPGAVLTERVSRGQRTAQLTLRWAFSGVGRTAETATVNITAPSPAEARTVVSYDCRP